MNGFEGQISQTQGKGELKYFIAGFLIIAVIAVVFFGSDKFFKGALVPIAGVATKVDCIAQGGLWREAGVSYAGTEAAAESQCLDATSVNEKPVCEALSGSFKDNACKNNKKACEEDIGGVFDAPNIVCRATDPAPPNWKWLYSWGEGKWSRHAPQTCVDTGGSFNGDLNPQTCTLSNVVYEFKDNTYVEDKSGGLVAHYKFEENGGTSLVDATGNGNTGVISGNPVWENGNLTFNPNDGTKDYISLRGTPSFDVKAADSFSFALWVKTKSENYLSILDRESGMPYYHLSIYLDNKVNLGLRGAEGGESVVQSKVPVNDDKWHQIVAVRDSSSKQLLIYLDGVLSNSQPDNSLGDLTANPEVPIGMGACCLSEGGQFLFDGSMHDLRVYKKALSATDISELHQSTKPKEPAGELVASWSFDEGSGNIAGDSSGNGNTGTFVNNPNWVDGIKGKALSFDGVDDYIDAGNPTSLNFGSKSFSISAWIKTADATNWKTIVSKGAANYSGAVRYYYMRIESKQDSGRFYTSISDAIGNEAGLYSVRTMLHDDKWHNVVMVVDRDSAKLSMSYIDGIQDGSVSTASVDNIDSETSFRIGVMGTQGYYYKGIIDEVEVYNKVLTAEEIKAKYDEITAQAQSKEPAGELVASWSFDDQSPETVFDSSGKGNNGVATSFYTKDNLKGKLSHSGLTAFVINNYGALEGWHTDASVAGASLKVDLGPLNRKGYRKASITAAQAYKGLLSIQHSDDDITWTDAATGFNPSGTGSHEIAWDSVGEHRYWRAYLTNTPGPGAWLYSFDLYEKGAVYVDGIKGKALKFDGSSGYVEIGASETLNTTGPMTISACFNITVLPSGEGGDDQRFIYRRSGNYGVGLAENANGTIQFVFVEQSGQVHYINSRQILNDGKWHCASGTYDQKDMKIYIDGKEDNSVPASGIAYFQTPSSTLGRNANEDNRYLEGLLDEVSIYNKALSAQEVETLYKTIKSVAAETAVPAIPTETPTVPPEATQQPVDPIKQCNEQGRTWRANQCISQLEMQQADQINYLQSQIAQLQDQLNKLLFAPQASSQQKPGAEGQVGATPTVDTFAQVMKLLQALSETQQKLSVSCPQGFAFDVVKSACVATQEAFSGQQLKGAADAKSVQDKAATKSKKKVTTKPKVRRGTKKK